MIVNWGACLGEGKDFFLGGIGNLDGGLDGRKLQFSIGGGNLFLLLHHGGIAAVVFKAS